MHRYELHKYAPITHTIMEGGLLGQPLKSTSVKIFSFPNRAEIVWKVSIRVYCTSVYGETAVMNGCSVVECP